MAVAMYVNFKEIPGECKESIHKSWMQIEHIQFNVRQNASARRSTGGSTTSGEADFGAIVVRMLMDSAYPKLAESCWLGKHHDDVTIDFCRSGMDKQLFHQYKFKNALITSVNVVADAAGDDSLPVVEYSFVYDEITNEYFQTDSHGGGISGSTITGFNVQKRDSV